MKAKLKNKFKKSLDLFGNHAAPTGWGYLTGGKLNGVIEKTSVSLR